jgi:hypothetical protein
MKIERNLYVNETDGVLRARAVSYLEKAGFTLITAQPDLTYQRGSVFGSLFAYNPKKWQASARVHIQKDIEGSSIVTLLLEVKNFGLWVTKAERDCWENELIQLQSAIRNGSGEPVINCLVSKYSVLRYLIALFILFSFVTIGILGSVALFESGQMFFWGGIAGLGVGVVISQSFLKFGIINQQTAINQPAAINKQNVTPTDIGIESDIMAKSIRSWGWNLIIVGVVSLIASSFLSATWGVMMILLGVGSFLVISPALFMLYAATLAWAGISNISGGIGGWSIFALLQFYWAYSNFRLFLRYKQIYRPRPKPPVIPDPYDPDPPITNEPLAATPMAKEDPGDRVFPWVALIVGVLSFSGMLLFFLVLIIRAVLHATSSVPVWLGFMVSLSVNIGLVALFAGLAALLCGYRHKPASVLGMITGGLVVLVEILLRIFS